MPEQALSVLSIDLSIEYCECCAHRRDEGKVHVPCNLLCKFSNLHMGGKRDWQIEF